MLSVIMLSVIMLSVIMLSVIMLSGILLNVVMLSVVAPFSCSVGDGEKSFMALTPCLFYRSIIISEGARPEIKIISLGQHLIPKYHRACSINIEIA